MVSAGLRHRSPLRFAQRLARQAVAFERSEKRRLVDLSLRQWNSLLDWLRNAYWFWKTLLELDASPFTEITA